MQLQTFHSVPFTVPHVFMTFEVSERRSPASHYTLTTDHYEWRSSFVKSLLFKTFSYRRDGVECSWWDHPRPDKERPALPTFMVCSGLYQFSASRLLDSSRVARDHLPTTHARRSILSAWLWRSKFKGTLHSKLALDFLAGLKVCIFEKNFTTKKISIDAVVT